MGLVAKGMARVPEESAENGIVCTFGEPHEQQYLVSVSRMGKKTFEERYQETAKERDELRHQLLDLRVQMLTLPLYAMTAASLSEEKEP
jgi:hypothetical protein